MEGFKVSAFAAPSGMTIDSDSQKLLGAMQEWLQKSFDDFARSKQTPEEYAKEISDKLKESGFSMESL